MTDCRTLLSLDLSRVITRGIDFLGKGHPMTIAINTESTFDIFQAAMDLVLESENSQDLCRRVVHSDFFADAARGAYVYLLNTRSNLVEAAGYGEPYAEGMNEISAWDENPASIAVRTKSLYFLAGNAGSDRNGALAFPLVQSKAPIGCFVVVLSPSTTQNPIPIEISSALEKLGGHFVATKGSGFAGAIGNKSGDGSAEDLTTRQVTILSFMGDGMTNAEISAKVLLSESTVRQETIRIYRALQVSGRQEAVAKARAIGLLPGLKSTAASI